MLLFDVMSQHTLGQRKMVGFKRLVPNARLLDKALEMQALLERLANEMQSASSQGDPVSPDWLDKRIIQIRALLREIDGE